MQHLNFDITVKIEKTDLAKELEKSTKKNWDLASGFPNDAGYDLRACFPETFATSIWL